MKKQPGKPITKIGVATSDWSGSLHDDNFHPIMGGACWIRFGQLAPFFKNHFVFGRLVISQGLPHVQSHDGRLHTDCSVIIMQRNMEDEVSDAVLNGIVSGRKIVNDVDDWFWGIHPNNGAAKAIDPKINKKSNIDFYKSTLEQSSLITVSTPFLKEQMEGWGHSVQLIQNHINYSSFKPRIHRKSIPIIGWCGSTGHRSNDLPILKKPFAELKTSGQKFFYHHTGSLVGARSFAQEVGLSEKDVTRLPLLTPQEYPSGFCFDIGVVPLSDVEFNEAKSWIKGLEYAAAGIPFIASPSREYVSLHDEFGIGRIASTPSEWVEHFIELSDFRVRSVEASRNRQIVIENFGPQVMANQWDELAWS
jgi:hypothetical protein